MRPTMRVDHIKRAISQVAKVAMPIPGYTCSAMAGPADRAVAKWHPELHPLHIRGRQRTAIKTGPMNIEDGGVVKLHMGTDN